MTSLTHPQVVSNLDMSYQTHVFFPPLWKSMGSIKCLITHILQNICFCVQQKKETRTGLKKHEGVEKLVNYSFKFNAFL